VPNVPRLHIELPNDLHRKAKIAAVERGQTLKALVIEAIERTVAEHQADEEAKGR
jgi:predicted HicB family RNase H-like nuclease